MKLGLIGQRLGHSWSPEIHRMLIGEDYALWELEPQSLPDFLLKRDFDGINVTIPYKQSVLPLLDEIDDSARRIGAVNTIVNDKGRLCGYNTDCLGLRGILENHGLPVAGADVAILGTGGASLAAVEAVRLCKGKPVRVSRTPASHGGTIGYDELYQRAFSVLINTTPVGMHPDVDAVPVEIGRIRGLRAVVDVVANPLRTALMLQAQWCGIKAFGGLEMLVTQAFYADRLFTGTRLDPAKARQCLIRLTTLRRNLVLIGMPASGKTTVAKAVAEKTGRDFADTDALVEAAAGRTIPEIFATEGEAGFRAREAEVIEGLKLQTGLVIATGGGVVLSERNMRNLAYNGLIIRLERKPELLEAGEGRPLARSRSDLDRLYSERGALYEKYADATVDNNAGVGQALAGIMRIIEGA